MKAVQLQEETAAPKTQPATHELIIGEIPLQPASYDIWDKKYRLKTKTGQPVDESIDDTMTGKPVVGDWDGSGVSRIGVVSSGVWYLDLDGNGIWDPAVDVSFLFGPTGIPVTGTW